MKRFLAVLLVLLFSAFLFATDLSTITLFTATKTNDLDWKHNERKALGAGIGVNLQGLEDLTDLYPFTYGLFVNLDCAAFVENRKEAEEAELNIEVGMGIGPVVAIDGEHVFLTLSLSPALYFSSGINTNQDQIESVSLGGYGNVLLYLGFQEDMGISFGLQSYLNLLTAREVNGVDSYLKPDVHLVPAVFVGLTSRM